MSIARLRALTQKDFTFAFAKVELCRNEHRPTKGIDTLLLPELLLEPLQGRNEHRPIKGIDTLTTFGVTLIFWPVEMSIARLRAFGIIMRQKGNQRYFFNN